MNELSERATLSLKTSLECSWNVKVRKSGRDVYFEDGWQKFLRDNSLGDCEFLLFNYDGKMHFTIQIFDKSGCERDDFPDTEQQNFNLAESTKRTGGRPTKYTVTGSKPFNSCKENSSNVIKCWYMLFLVEPAHITLASDSAKFHLYVKLQVNKLQVANLIISKRLKKMKKMMQMQKMLSPSLILQANLEVQLIKW